MSKHELLRPQHLRRLIVDLENDTVLIDATAEVGIVEIDLFSLQANDASAVLSKYFDTEELALIKRFGDAAMRDFE